MLRSNLHNINQNFPNNQMTIEIERKKYEKGENGWGVEKLDKFAFCQRIKGISELETFFSA